MSLESLYGDVIKDHAVQKHHSGLREPFDAEAHHVNPVCGDQVTLRVALKGAGDEAIVADVSYEALGCQISIAATSAMSDLVIGKSVSNAMALWDEFLTLMHSKGQAVPDEDVLEDAAAFAGVSKYPARIKCALLGWMAWKDATARALEVNR
jgi:nitrogen fixation protein NifU and related proteins